MLFTLNFVSYVKVYKPFLIRKSQVTALCFVRGLTLKSACFNPIEYGYFFQIAENIRIWFVGNYVIHHSYHKKAS